MSDGGGGGGAASGGFRVARVARIEARLVAPDWPWARDNAAAIAANWRRRQAAHPGIFDGRVLMARAWGVARGGQGGTAGDTGRLDLFETGYSTFLAHRDGLTDGAAANAFAAIVPWSADGAVLVGEMGAHTANAGQFYFPCGTPDRDDVRGARVDIAGSAGRELFEETGLSEAEGAGGDWLMLEGEGQVAFLRPVRFPEAADALIARIDRHRTREAEPELAGVRALRGLADFDPARMPGFVRAYLAHAFG